MIDALDRAVARAMRRLPRDRRAAALLEFAILAPAFCLFIFCVFGAALIAFYQQSLDDAVRDAVRQIQMAAPASTSGGSFVGAVCAEFGMVATTCQSAVTYAVQAGTAAGGFSALTPEALDSSGRLSNSFFAGNAFAPNVPVLVQVAYPLPFSVPYVGSVITGTGTSAILAQAAIRAEPYQ